MNSSPEPYDEHDLNLARVINLSGEEATAGGLFLVSIFVFLWFAFLWIVFDTSSVEVVFSSDGVFRFFYELVSVLVYVPPIFAIIFGLNYFSLHKRRAFVISRLDSSRLRLQINNARGSMWTLNPRSWPFRFFFSPLVVFSLRKVGNKVNLDIEIEGG